MKVEEIDTALGHALISVPQVSEAVALSKCDLAEACQAFLRSLAESSGPLAAPVFRTAHGAITKWRQSHGC